MGEGEWDILVRLSEHGKIQLSKFEARYRYIEFQLSLMFKTQNSWNSCCVFSNSIRILVSWLYLFTMYLIQTLRDLNFGENRFNARQQTTYESSTIPFVDQLNELQHVQLVVFLESGSKLLENVGDSFYGQYSPVFTMKTIIEYCRSFIGTSQLRFRICQLQLPTCRAFLVSTSPDILFLLN